ncbi:MAG: MarR family transcriptional regulator [Ignavibacteria bacterium]|nr:MarR family transcriptional regulator [Ignavibacteria bacterium]
MKTTEKYGKKTDAALSLWVKLARAYSTVNKKSVESITKFGLTEGQFGVIETLGHLGPLTIGNICKKQLVSGGNMTLVLDNLEKEGLVRRVPSREDRRAIIIELTEKGQDLFNKIFLEHARDITAIFEVLDCTEIAQLSELLKKLGTSIK